MNREKFLKLEEQLCKAESTLRKRKKQIEQLSKTSEFVNIPLKTTESLSVDTAKFVMPLPVKGTMLPVGKHFEKLYTEEDLLWAETFHNGKKIPIKFDHKHLENFTKPANGRIITGDRKLVGTIIGAIDEVYYDRAEKALKYRGHINDEVHARNIFDGVVSHVSATILSMGKRLLNGILRGFNPEIEEMSIVDGPQAKGANIEPDV